MTDSKEKPFFDALVEPRADAPEGAPNILLVMSDEHHWACSGYAGHPVVETPALDRLAAGGVNFTQAYCNSPLSSPSRQSFMTGLYPNQVGMWNNCCGMPENSVTWAHALSAAGYETLLCGKMHFNGYQKMYGFDRRPVLDGDNSGRQFHSWGLRTSHDWTRPLPYRSGGGIEDVKAAGADTPERQPIFQHDARVVAGTVDVLREKAADPDGRPWALCCGIVLPHPPFRARADLMERYAGKADLPVNVRGEGLGIVDDYLRQFYKLDPAAYSDEDILRLRAAYFGLVTEFDEYFGQIMSTLEETGQDRDTIVIYVSDHGELAGEHGMVGKVSLRESSVRVPLLISRPGHYAEGGSVDTPVSLVDLFPTLLDMAGAAWPEVLPLDGHSLVPLLEGRPDAFGGDGSIFCEFEGEGWNHPRCFLRVGDWKYVFNHTGPHELYNLADDPDELRNLVDDPAHAQRAAALRDRILESWDPAAIETQVLQTQARQRIAYNRNVACDLGW